MQGISVLIAQAYYVKFKFKFKMCHIEAENVTTTCQKLHFADEKLSPRITSVQYCGG